MKAFSYRQLIRLKRHSSLLIPVQLNLMRRKALKAIAPTTVTAAMFF